jgi:hypothetical protein
VKLSNIFEDARHHIISLLENSYSKFVKSSHYASLKSSLENQTSQRISEPVRKQALDTLLDSFQRKYRNHVAVVNRRHLLLMGFMVKEFCRSVLEVLLPLCFFVFLLPLFSINHFFFREHFPYIFLSILGQFEGRVDNEFLVINITFSFFLLSHLNFEEKMTAQLPRKYFLFLHTKTTSSRAE